MKKLVQIVTLLCLPLVAAAEPYLVWTDTTLFGESGEKRLLSAGRAVDAVAAPRQDWLDVRLDDVAFRGKASDFRSRRQLDLDLAVELAGLEIAIERRQRELEDSERQYRQLQEQQVDLLLDERLVFCVPSVHLFVRRRSMTGPKIETREVEVSSPIAGVRQRSVRSVGERRVHYLAGDSTVDYAFEDKLNAADAKRLHRALGEKSEIQIEALTRQQTALAAALTERALLQRRRDDLRLQLDYLAAHASDPFADLAVTRRRAWLHRDGRQVRQADAGVIFRTRPGRKGAAQVLAAGEWLSCDGDDLTSVPSARQQQTKEQRDCQDQLATIAAQLARRSALRDQLQAAWQRLQQPDRNDCGVIYRQVRAQDCPACRQDGQCVHGIAEVLSDRDFRGLLEELEAELETARAGIAADRKREQQLQADCQAIAQGMTDFTQKLTGLMMVPHAH